MNHPQPSAFEQYNGTSTLPNMKTLLHFWRRISTRTDDPRVVTGMNLLIDTCWNCAVLHARQKLASARSLLWPNGIIKYTIDALVSYLRRFATDDTRIDDFECTAKALLLAYGAQMDANHAAAQANGIHSWQGRAAYELLASADYLTQGAINC